jgi:hypothetical protein
LSSNIDPNSEEIVLSEASKRKKKISEFKELLLKQFLLLSKDNVLDSFDEFFKTIEKSQEWGLTILGIKEI